MSEVLVPLNQILPNPWQTRQPRAGDDGHVAELAADIRARGLLQPPLGRIVDAVGRPLDVDLDEWAHLDQAVDVGYDIQLAFGHHRVAAYYLLADTEPERYGQMPLRIAALTDQDMALAAWSENAARKDLTPAEAARAIQRMMEQFGWSQADVAERLLMSRPAVSNKLRLLRLPEQLLAQLDAGELSERQALAILPVFELPPAAQEQLQQEGGPNSWEKRQLQEVIAHPDRKSSSDVRQAVRHAVRSVTLPLSTDGDYNHAHFPVDREVAGVAAPICQDCPNRLQETRCADLTCYYQKQAAFERAELAFAAAATGLPMITRRELSGMTYRAHSEFYPSAEDQAALQRALDRHCPNLHLLYDPPRTEGTYNPLAVPDYPCAVYTCIHPGEPCGCQDEGKAEQEAKKRAAEEQCKREAHALREVTARELAKALRAQDLGAWRAVLWALGQSNYNPSRAEVSKIRDLGALCEKIARAALRDAVRWDYPSKNGVAADLAEWRARVGFVSPAQPGETTQEG